MSERAIQLQQEGMKRSIKDRITTVMNHGKEKISKNPIREQKKPQIHEKHRPIEQVLVGAWNAVKPESQGKAIMKVYDKYIHPKYQNEEERKRAATLRPKIEKIVGWTAVGTEAALITFGAVKGYQKLRSIDWSTLTHKRESRFAKKKRLLRVRRIGRTEAEIAFDMAMAAIKDEAHMAPIQVFDLLFGDEIPVDIKEKFAPDFFRRVFAKVQDPEFGRILNMSAPGYQRSIMFGAVGRIADDMLMGVHEPIPGFDYEAYLWRLKGWFLHVGCPGIDQFGIQMK